MQRLLKFTLKIIKRLVIIVISIVAIFIFLGSFILIIDPSVRPWYHDPSIEIEIINLTENPIKIEYITADSDIFIINKYIREGVSIYSGSRLGLEYYVEYNKKINLGIRYKIASNGELLSFEKMVDRSRYRSCFFIILISDDGNNISDCRWSETKGID